MTWRKEKQKSKIIVYVKKTIHYKYKAFMDQWLHLYNSFKVTWCYCIVPACLSVFLSLCLFIFLLKIYKMSNLGTFLSLPWNIAAVFSSVKLNKCTADSSACVGRRPHLFYLQTQVFFSWPYLHWVHFLSVSPQAHQLLDSEETRTSSSNHLFNLELWEIFNRMNPLKSKYKLKLFIKTLYRLHLVCAPELF